MPGKIKCISFSGNHFNNNFPNFSISASSSAAIFWLLSNFDFKNNNLLWWGYLSRMAVIIFPTDSSFTGRGAVIVAAARSLVGFFLMIASSVAILLCEMLLAFTALLCRPSSCFLLRPPRLQYCWCRLFTKFEVGWAFTISFNISNSTSILLQRK